jgi:DNA repair exonuclease SbcCD ATPase subunit
LKRTPINTSIHVSFSSEVVEMKMARLKESTNFQQQCDQYKQKINDLKTSQKSLEDLLQEYRTKISNIEKDSLHKIRLAKEEEWNKISKLESEKSSLESEYALARQKLNDIENTFNSLKVENEAVTFLNSGN